MCDEHRAGNLDKIVGRKGGSNMSDILGKEPIEIHILVFPVDTSKSL